MAIKLMAVKLGGKEWDMREECTRFGTTIVFQRKMLYLCIVVQR